MAGLLQCISERRTASSAELRLSVIGRANIYFRDEQAIALARLQLSQCVLRSDISRLILSLNIASKNYRKSSHAGR